MAVYSLFSLYGFDEIYLLKMPFLCLDYRACLDWLGFKKKKKWSFVKRNKQITANPKFVNLCG
jgi:hypothetical protein